MTLPRYLNPEQKKELEAWIDTLEKTVARVSNRKGAKELLVKMDRTYIVVQYSTANDRRGFRPLQTEEVYRGKDWNAAVDAYNDLC